MKKVFLFLTFIFSFITYVNAECLDNSYLEFIREAKLKYKIIDESNSDYLYYLYVDPKRDDIELKSTNDLYSGVTNSIEIEGNIAIPSYIHYENKTYKVEVYAKKTSSVCAGELLTTLTLEVPPYNYYSKTQYCVDNPNLDICQTMSNTNNLTNEEFVEEINTIEDKEKEKPLWYIIIFDYLIWILIPALVIGLFYYGKINKVKKVKENA